MKRNEKTRWWRLAVLLGLLVFVTIESYMHQVLGGGKAPSVHALCPLGALESLYTLLFLGSFIQKIYSGTVVLLVVTVVLALLFRRGFCGLLCPFGALQELFAMLGRKIWKKQFVMPQFIDRPLRYLKYVLLLLTISLAWYYGSLWMSPYDPYAAYAHITSISDSIVEDPLAIIGFILLAVTILGSLLYDRFYCKYLCPVGAFYGIIGKISPTRVERNDELCTHCKVCNKACPVNIDVEKASKVTNAECINCNLCVMACPKKGALEVKTAKKAFQPAVMLVMVVGLFFGTILVAQATGNYQIVPEALKEGEIIPVSEIKGYYTIEEAAIATGLSLPELYAKMGIPENVSKGTMMKEIANQVAGYSFDEAKEEAGAAKDAAEKSDASKESGSANNIDVSGIKGSMTVRQAAEALNMELKEVYRLFEIPESVPPQTQMKGIGALSPGYEFDKVKESLQ